MKNEYRLEQKDNLIFGLKAGVMENIQNNSFGK